MAGELCQGGECVERGGSEFLCARRDAPVVEGGRMFLGIPLKIVKISHWYPTETRMQACSRYEFHAPAVSKPNDFRTSSYYPTGLRLRTSIENWTTRYVELGSCLTSTSSSSSRMLPVRPSTLPDLRTVRPETIGPQVRRQIETKTGPNLVQI